MADHRFTRRAKAVKKRSTGPISGSKTLIDPNPIEERHTPAKKSNFAPQRSRLLARVFMIAAACVGTYLYVTSQIQFFATQYALDEGGDVVRAEDEFEVRSWNISCSNQYRPFIRGCHPVKTCRRVVINNFINSSEVDRLRDIAEKGMRGRSSSGGPTIMDANSGYVKDGDGLTNLYHGTTKNSLQKIFTQSDYDLYRKVIERIRARIMSEFSLSTLYFSAPTFITRAVGNASWMPKDLHDEYWHPHIDKDNTHHYDYSGLLYLAERRKDFEGGLFAFIDDNGKRNTTIEPARGRLMIFSSGKENFHQVRKVTKGVRYVMSMWFTCNKEREFKAFLDGRMHREFAKRD